MQAMAIAFTETDVYGQSHPIETPELTKLKLEDLNKTLDEVGDQHEGWCQAKRMCPELVDDKFKLQFLRCEVFNVDVSNLNGI